MFNSQLLPRWIVSAGAGLALVSLVSSPGVSPAVAADDSVVTPNIVGGTQATIADAPWQVALIGASAENEYQGQFCGGSIIAAQWIATAAHCVVDDFGTTAANAIKVLAGQATLNTSANTRPVAVSNIYVHPNYVSSANHDDIALLRLAAPLTLVAGSVQAIGLPSAVPTVGATELITGWGDRISGGGLYPQVLRKAQIQVFADSTCGNVYGGYSNAKMVCAANNAYTIDTCQGDSGGPMARNTGSGWVLDGITSFGAGCAQYGYPGVYTEVYNYLTWINGYVGSVTSSFTTAPSPSISGTAVVAQTLTANPRTWSPTPDSFAYQWNVGGVPVSGAAGAGSTYVVQSADVGSRISVTVTATKSGYTATAKTSASTASVTQPFVTVPVATIAGTKVVGRTLTAREGLWSPTPTSYRYRWLSSTSRTGTFTPILGATLKTYVLKSTDRGRFLKVEVTAIKTGFVQTKSTSTSTIAIG